VAVAVSATDGDVVAVVGVEDAGVVLAAQAASATARANIGARTRTILAARTPFAIAGRAFAPPRPGMCRSGQLTTHDRETLVGDRADEPDRLPEPGGRSARRVW
jgi:hypothetical protein